MDRKEVLRNITTEQLAHIVALLTSLGDKATIEMGKVHNTLEITFTVPLLT